MAACRGVWNFSSSVQLDPSLVRCTNSRDIKLNTKREIPYLSSPPFIILYFFEFPRR